MFKIDYSRELNVITLEGNFDSGKSDEAKNVFQEVKGEVTVEMSKLDFISSSGVGILVMAYKQLKESEGNISLLNLKPHIKKVFEISLLDTIFNIK